MSNLKKLTTADAAHLIHTIKTFFFDCDGVLWNSYGAIGGAVELVNKLKEMNKTLFFVTNNSSASRKDYLKKFKKFGINVEPEQILPTSYLAARYVKSILKVKKVYMIGGQGLADEFEEEGIEYIGLGPQLPNDDPTKHYALNFDTEMDPQVEAVVVAFDPHFNLNKISQAMQYVLVKGLPLIATNTDSSYPLGNGRRTPGTGCIVNAVKTACGKEPTVLGKPNKLLYEIAQTITDIQPETTLMIGDRLDTDIAFGKNCNFHTLCVLSGITNEQDLQNLENTNSDGLKKLPDYYTDSLQDLYSSS